MAYSWFRMYAHFATDDNIQSMPEAMQRRLVMLYCLQRSGELAFLRAEEIAFLLRISPVEWADTKTELRSRGLFSRDGQISGWEESQGDERPAASIWYVIRKRIFARDDYTCAYCQQRGGRLECDHVIPVSRGGSHADDNLVTSCFTCNRSKRAKLMSEWRPA